MTENSTHCFANATTFSDAENLNFFSSSAFTIISVCGFVATLLIIYYFLIKRGNSNAVVYNPKYTAIPTIILPPRSSSCPVLKNYNIPENPAILDVKQLREIVNNDYIHESELVADYGCGGYMPITLGKTVGPKDKYEIIRKLGWGHFSTVWLARDTSSEEYCAVKICKSAYVYTTVAIDEINILKCVKTKDPAHEGYKKVVMILEHFQEISMNGRHICMSLEIMGPSLLHLIMLSNYRGIEQKAAKKIIRQILVGLTYLHDVCRIIHTDIKPENILIQVTNEYVYKMVEYVNRFNELGVEMPKSYISSSNWADHINLYDQAGCSNFPTQQVFNREKSYPGDLFEMPQHSSKRQYHNGDPFANPLFINPDIQVKIADLGNACWSQNHYADVIQTVQYRSLEVILEAGYNCSADMWSLACVAFELCTGEYLFNPQHTNTLSLADDHLGLIWEVLDGIPKYVALSGRVSRQHFDSDGSLIKIRPSNMKIWKVEDVLVDKYRWKRVDAIIFADFIQSLIEPDKELRATATVALTKDWLREADEA